MRGDIGEIIQLTIDPIELLRASFQLGGLLLDAELGGFDLPGVTKQLDLGALSLDGMTYRAPQQPAVELVLHHVVLRTPLDGRQRQPVVIDSRKHDHRDVCRCAADRVQRFHSGGVGKLQVEHHCVERAGLSQLFQRGPETVDPRDGEQAAAQLHRAANLAQRPPHHFGVGWTVFDQQQSDLFDARSGGLFLHCKLPQRGFDPPCCFPETKRVVSPQL